MIIQTTDFISEDIVVEIRANALAVGRDAMAIGTGTHPHAHCLLRHPPKFDVLCFSTCYRPKNYARKFELGLRFGGRQSGGETSLVSYDMFRAGVAEFLGMAIFRFIGEDVTYL